MDDHEIVQELSWSGSPRASLYLSPSKVEQRYVQTVGQVSEFVRSSREGGKLSASLLKIIGGEWSTEDGFIRFKDDRVRTAVITFKVRDRTYASIASTDFVDLGLLASYWQSGTFGILGRLERSLAGVSFLAPLWIWSEGW